MEQDENKAESLYRPSPWFKVYPLWQPIIEGLTDAQAGELFKKSIEYASTGIEPTFKNDVVKLAFRPIKTSIQQSNQSVERKRQGGIKSGETRRKQAEERNKSTDEDT